MTSPPTPPGSPMSDRSDVNIYAEGIAYMSVCAPVGWEPGHVVAEACRLRGAVWQLSPDPTFRTGEPNPNPCNKDSQRVHYLLEC